MTIGELNTKVEIRVYTSSQDADTGQITSSLTTSWDKWAKVEQLNGSRILDQAAITYKEAYKITVRHEATRLTLSNYKVFYSGKLMTIHSVVKEFEGKIWWEILTAYTQT